MSLNTKGQVALLAAAKALIRSTCIVCPLRFAAEQIDHPAAADVVAWFAAMFENYVLITPGTDERISQN